MNWKRILAFSLLLFFTSLLFGVITGVLISKVQQLDQPISNFIIASPTIFNLIVSTVFYYILAKKECLKPVLQALLVWLLSQLIEVTLELLIIPSITLDTLLSDIVFSIIPAIMGTVIGKNRKK